MFFSFPGPAGLIARTLTAAAVVFGTATVSAQAAPATTHPRLWVTQADIPRLQSWAVSSNPLWTNGLFAAATAAATLADAHWNYTSGRPDSGWMDDGGTGWEADDTEAYAEMFAFMSLVDPSAANRAQWAKRAHAMLMWVMNQAALPPQSGTAFRDPDFITYNRANYWGEAWGLIVDWIYPSLTSADKATIRTVILQWGQALLNASTAGQEHPQPVGLLNDLRLIGGSSGQAPAQRQAAQLQFRWAANNYFIGHMRNMTLLALAFDPQDDVPVTSGIDGSVAGLLTDSIGAWLYQAYAMFENPSLSAKLLHAPGGNRSLGAAYGGLPVEGPLYGESMGYLFETLLAYQTAGYTNTKTYGPQIGLINSNTWNLAADGFLHSVSPGSAILSDATYLGPVYRPAANGDELRDWVTQDRIDLFGSMAVLDRKANPTRYAKDIWIATNVLEGGPTFLTSRASNIWGNSYASYGILYFLAFDPAIAAPVDPRPGIAPEFTMPAIGRVLARSTWGPDASWFSFRCGPETINHVSGDCGQFEFYRKGTWLTKQWSGYAIDGLAYDPQYHNIMAIQNTKPSSVLSVWATNSASGGQWNNGGNNGDPGVALSVNDNWAYGRSDATNLYNHPDYWMPKDAAKNVTLAVRSVVWLNPDHVIVHDIADTGAANRFKQMNLVLLNSPAINGNTAVATKHGQQLTVQSLLPANAVLSEQHNWKTSPTQEFNAVSQEELAYTRLLISSSLYANDENFLEVLQGTDAGTAADPATLLTTSGGTPFEGAIVNRTAILFPASKTAFTTLSYIIPATVTQQLITGLTPNGTFTVTQISGADGITVRITPGGTSSADGGGVLAIGFPASAHPTQTAYRTPAGLIQPPWDGGF